MLRMSVKKTWPVLGRSLCSENIMQGTALISIDGSTTENTPSQWSEGCQIAVGRWNRLLGSVISWYGAQISAREACRCGVPFVRARSAGNTAVMKQRANF